jgi:uncharacterized membrane protein YfcA
MDFLPPLSELYPFFLALIATGAVAGFLAGLFGVGGGAVLVPVFYQMLTVLGVDEAVRMHVAVGSSLAIIVPTSLQSFRKHKARGAVDMDLLKSFLFFVPFGVVCASIVTAYLSGASLRIIFAVMAFIIAMKLLFGRDSWKLGNDIPPNPLRGLAGWLIGFFSTFMGIGGGVFNNTFMTLFNRPMHQSVATSSGVGVLISVPGFIGYILAGLGETGLPPFSIGFVNLLMVALVIPITLFVAPIGVNVAHKLTKRQLEVGFGLFLVIVSIRFFLTLL